MHKFLPHYPERDLLSPELFLGEIAAKKEFITKFLESEHLYPHQEFIVHFVSPYTKYDELLLFHEMGSGKTQSAIAVAESLMTNPNSGIKRTVVIVRGKGLGQNFIHELVVNSTDGKYTDEKVLSWKKYYKIWTMEVFGKVVAKLSDRDLLNQFNNSLFIVDEAHHLKKKLHGTYDHIHRLFHLLPNRKILLLTGTPMKDDASEFANCANLLLAMESQLPFGNEFNQTYFHKDRLTNRDILRERLSGLISFHKGRGPDIEKVFDGAVVKPMKHIPVVLCPMDSFQEHFCREAHKLDARDSVVYINSRQASLFVFPDGSYGRAGFKRYIRAVKRTTLMGKTTVSYVLDADLVSAITENLGRHSVKFKRVVEMVSAPDRPKTFIYLEFVHGSGAILLGEILKLNGYSQATGRETTPGKRFILATTQSLSSNIIDLIKRFNDPDNDRGEVIQIFIGSQIISEGYSLKNVSREIILTPHWNFSETEQIIARCWRINSHTTPDRKLTVSLLTVAIDPLLSSGSVFERYGVDLYMYKTSEVKDYRIKQLERLLKEISVDCHNYVPPRQLRDMSRDCDYAACAVDCAGAPSAPDQASYDILYPPYERLEAFFTTLFSSTASIELDRVLTSAATDETVTLSYIADLLFGNIPLTINGDYKFLKKTGNILYVTDNPTVPVDSLVALPPLLDRSISAQELLRDLESRWLMDSLRLLFEEKTAAKNILHKLPRDYQHLILTSCLYARRVGTGNAAVIADVLKFYEGFFRDDDPIHVWLFHEKFGTLCLKMTDDAATWEPAERDLFQEIRDRMYRSPIGYYGLFNPHLNEFCLRRVTETSETDLRRVNVGRRCDDWDQKSLTAIVRDKLKLSIDPAAHNRATLCEIIKREMWARDLVMYNFDCGNQFKIRGRI